MSSTHQTGIYEIAPREPRLLQHAAPIRVQCLEGSLWLTCYGDSRDLILGAGRDAELPAGASVVVSTRGHARYRITPVSGPHRATGLRAWLASVLAGRASQALAGRVQQHVIAADGELV